MKKIIMSLVSVVMAVLMLVTLTACNPRPQPDVKAALADAKTMTLAQLEEAAKKEFEASSYKFTAQGLSSGMGKVLNAFKEKYTWFDYEDFSSIKDSAMYTNLETTVANGGYFADVIMTQDGSSLSAFIENGSVLSHEFTDSNVKLDADDVSPLAAVYFNKVFMYNKKNYTTETLTNVWQLTGKDGATKKGMPGISFQNPADETINMEFLIMMTSPAAKEKLASAYQSYFGTAYTDKEGYASIGHYFIAELLGNVKAWHKSDTTEGKTNLATNDGGLVFYIGVNKLKDYGKEVEGVDKAAYKTDVAVPGLNGVAHLEGFDGFTYKMWLMVPKTSSFPYTAALFSRFMLSAEGYSKGWTDMGYYSANQNAASNKDDISLTEWKANCLVEDIEYINSVYTDVSAYVRSLVSK